MNNNPLVLLRRIVRRICHLISFIQNRAPSSDCRLTSGVIPIRRKLFDSSLLDCLGIDRANLQVICSNYIEHRFDLLGSGWVENSYQSEALGVEKYHYEMNLNIGDCDEGGEWIRQVVSDVHWCKSRQIWNLIEGSYAPIDWQKDFKSGFRYCAKTMSQKIPIGHLPGVDIKVPWELARLQHLPQMGILALMCPGTKTRMEREFRNQVVDFIAMNPPGMGVNWMCTMDVAIRAANILLAYDLFKQIDDDSSMSSQFDEVIADSMYLHGVYIVDHLEYNAGLTGNHYLANIVGLFCIACYLDHSEVTALWAAFALQELIAECFRQFYADGGNFEASTCYHRLSTEMLLFGTAMALGMASELKPTLMMYNHQRWKGRPALLPPEKQAFNLQTTTLFPSQYLERLWSAIFLTLCLTKPNGRVPQIGDNDSGRFLKLTPTGTLLSAEEIHEKYAHLNRHHVSGMHWDEDSLDHRTLVSMAYGLFGSPQFESDARRYPFEASFIRSLARRIRLPEKDYSGIRQFRCSKDVVHSDMSFRRTTVVKPAYSGEKLTIGLDTYFFPQSGLCVIKSPRIHLTLAATPNGHWGFGVHTHNDKLSIELFLDGEDVFLDRGTYLYTPIVERRNEFRSVVSHNVALVDDLEQNRWRAGLRGIFAMKSDTRCQFLVVGEYEVVALVYYRGVKHQRSIRIEDTRIVIEDLCNRPFQVRFDAKKIISPGYGKLEKLPAARSSWTTTKIENLT